MIVVGIIVPFDDVVGIDKCFVVADGVLNLLPDPVGDQVIYFIIVFMEIDRFMIAVVDFEDLPTPGIGKEMIVAILFCFSFVCSQGIKIVDRFFDKHVEFEFSFVEL